MGYWFDKKDTVDKHTEPYSPTKTEQNMQGVSFSKEFQVELYNDHIVLNNLHTMLFTMLMHCKSTKSKKMVVTEEDLSFLFNIAGKKIQLKEKV